MPINWKQPPVDPTKNWINRSLEMQINLTCNWTCVSCFSGNTQIKMADHSLKLISEIKAGDMVLSYDEDTKIFVPRRVLKTMVRETDEVYKITTEKWQCRPTFVTGEHPLLVKNKGWVQVKDIRPGDVILHLSLSEQRRLHNPMKNPEIAAKVGIKKRGVPFIWTEEHRQRVSEIARNRMLTKNPMKDPAIAIKGFLNRKDRGAMTQPERFTLEIGKDFGLEFVGDGSLVVGNKVPDFVIKGTNKLIEVWDANFAPFMKRDQAWINSRRSIFQKNGYEVEFIAVDFKRNRQEERDRISGLLAQYARNGATVLSINKITAATNTKAWVRLAGTAKAKLNVYNLEVEGTHTYVANSLIAHNCDSFSQFPLPFTKRGTMTMDQIDHFIKEMQENNAYIGRIRFVGGEPTTNRMFAEIVSRIYKGLVPEFIGCLEVITNGTHLEVVKPVRQLLSKVRVSGEAAKDKAHTASLVHSPASLGYQGTICGSPWHCGISLNYWGYYPCSGGAGLARFRDWGEWQRTKLPLSVNWTYPEKPTAVRDNWPDLQLLCNHCHYALNPADKIKSGTRDWSKNKPNEENQKLLDAWMAGKLPSWKVYGSE